MLNRIKNYIKKKNNKNKANTSESDNQIKKVIAGITGSFGGSIMMNLLMIIITCVVVVVVIAAPLLLLKGAYENIKGGIKSALSEIRSAFKSSDSTSFSDFLKDNMAMIDDMVMSSNKEVDSLLKDYTKELAPVYVKYNEQNIEIDIGLITSAVFYDSNVDDIAFNNKSIGSEESYEINTEEVDEESLEKIRERFEDIEALADNMVSNEKIDDEKFKKYLMEIFIPKRYPDKYSTEEELEKIADEIIEDSKEYDFSSDIDVAQTGAIYSECSEVCTTTNECYDLEEFVTRVVDHESGGFTSFTNNYAEQWKAQAVAARTYTIFVSNSCKTPVEIGVNLGILDPSSARSQHDKIKEAIKETQGQIMTLNGKTILAVWDSFYMGNNYHCDDTYCYATYEKTGLTWDGGQQHEIKSYKKWQSYYSGGHGKGLSQYGAAYLADTGMNYKDILKFYYADGMEIRTLRTLDTLNTSLFTEGLLFPVGVNSKTGQCVSAGNYYSGGTYHGAVDIASSNMGYYGEHVDLPIVASIGGQIYALERNSWCSNNQYYNTDTRLPIREGCQGNNLSILVDDKNSKYYGYRFIYYHLDSVAEGLKIGDRVETGQFLGYMGSTGNSTGEHLHFGIRDPLGNNLNSYPVPDYVTRLIEKYCAENIDKGA